MCNYCGGSGLINLSDFKMVPSLSLGLSCCPYCEKGRESEWKIKSQQNAEKATSAVMQKDSKFYE